MPRLLLIQNNSTVGEHLRRTIMTMPGMEVSGLTVGLPQALRSLRLCPPDLVLMDLQLRRSVLEAFLDELSRRPRESRPPVLVGALSLDDPNLMEAIAQGADGYYLHGGPPQTLHDTILKLLCGESPMAPVIARQARSMFEAPCANALAWQGTQARLSEEHRRMLARIGDGYLVHEVAQELQTTPHDVGLGIRSLYRQLQHDRRGTAKGAPLN